MEGLAGVKAGTEKDSRPVEAKQSVLTSPAVRALKSGTPLTKGFRAPLASLL